MSERNKNQLLPYIARKQKLYLCNIRHIFSISCHLWQSPSRLSPQYRTCFGYSNRYSSPNTVPVSGAQTGTATPNTVPVSGAQTGTVTPNTVPVLGAQTGTVTPNTVPVSGAQTGTVNSPAASTVPVIVPVLGTKTGTVDASNPLCHKASPSPNIDKDKYFHSVNSSQYDSMRTENSSQNGSIHNPTNYRIF